MRPELPLFVAALLCCSAPAVAKAPPPRAVLGADARVEVTFVSTVAGVRFDVEQHGAVIANCVDRCTLHLDVARYHIATHESEDTAYGRTSVFVGGAGAIHITPEARGKKGTYLAFAIAGTSVFGLALLTAAATAMRRCSMSYDCPELSAEEQRIQDARDRDSKRATYISLGVAAVGAAIGTIGWVGFGDARKPDIESRPHRGNNPQRASPGFSLSVAPAQKGASVMGVVWF